MSKPGPTTIYKAIDGSFGVLIDGHSTHHNVTRYSDGTFSVGYDGEWLVERVSREQAVAAALKDWNT